MAGSPISLSFRDRFALMARALIGTMPLDASSVGGRLLTGVLSPGGEPVPRGTREYLGAYSKMPWLRAVASRVSFDVAATDWKLFVRRAEGRARRDRALQRAGIPQRKALIKSAVDQGDVQEVTSHVALDLLHTANQMQTGLQMRRVTQLHMDLVGEAFWLIERGPLDQPVALWPIPPSWVSGTPTPSTPYFSVSFKGWQGDIPASEMVWFADVDPLNPYGRGTGTAQALSDELETDEYASKHVKAFFFNRARPDIVVSPKGGNVMEPEEVERLEEGWTSRTQGFWRAFKPYFLRREVEIKELSQGDFQSQQMVPLREYERDTILQVFGVSPETLGIVGKGSNRATVTMGDVIYSKRVLVPRLEMLRSVLQERFVAEFDERLIVDYVSPVVADHEMELEAAGKASWALSVDEWRALSGHEPLADGAGEIHMAPATQIPVDFNRRRQLDLTGEPPPPPAGE